MTPFSITRLVIRSLAYHRRAQAAVLLGIMAATAVLTGALLVGDSVRGSLRALALDRLGKIDHMLTSDRFFRQQLVDEFLQGNLARQSVSTAVPAIVMPACTLEVSGRDIPARSSNVLVVGCDEQFWTLDSGSLQVARHPQPGEIILNAPLASDLGVEVGGLVIVRLPTGNQVPADSPLGRRTDRIQNVAELRVIEIVQAEGLGRFGLRSSQQLPRNAFLPLESMQSELRQEGKINAILVAGRTGVRQDAAMALRLTQELSPSLADYGLSISHVRRVYEPPGQEPEVTHDYFQLVSQRLLLTDDVVEAALAAWSEWRPQPLMTYLAMTIAKVAEPNRKVPVSTITGVDPHAVLGPWKPSDISNGSDDDNSILLSSWAAQDLGATIGDSIRVSYFDPETTHGEPILKETDFLLRGIVEVIDPVVGFRPKRPPVFDRSPTLANDPDLTPTVEGFSDQETIDNWDPPFPYDKQSMRSQDHTYWANHRTTPKAFVTLAKSRELWGSRFGNTTSLRVPASGIEGPTQLEALLVDEMRRRGVRLSLEFMPIKSLSLMASAGTTPFDFLFLGLSLFIIVAALMLVVLLFRLGMERRAREIGALLAMGFPRSRVRRIWLGESLGVAVAGGIGGVPLGIGYAWLMLVGLRTWWLGAISTPFLHLHISPLSLLIGLASGCTMSALVIAWTLRDWRDVPERQLLSGKTTRMEQGRGRAVWGPKVAGALLLLALCLGGLAVRLSGEVQAGAFVSAGALVLAAALIVIRWELIVSDSRPARSNLILPVLALSNAARAPGRTVLTIGLIASACFLIIAMSAFRLDPSLSGAGGFDLVGISSQPVFEDLNRPQTRNDRFGADARKLDDVELLDLRFKPGDDASCNNLYQATQPQVIGITTAFRDRFDRQKTIAFEWAARPSTPDVRIQANPWHALFDPSDAVVPVVLDKNTAMYSLHLMNGVGEEFSLAYDGGKKIRFRVVGLLANSILQGSLLISEQQFTRIFPEIAGYRYFLARVPPSGRTAVKELLENSLSDQGLDMNDTQGVLVGLLAVQNTYLSTFQSLGALGLLLGTFGLAAVQLRNVWERTAEIALLRAAGFSPQRVAMLIALEHSQLLVAGLATGAVAALVAVLPHALSGGAATPWRDLLVMLAMILLAGIGTGWLAVRSALRMPLIAGLRAE